MACQHGLAGWGKRPGQSFKEQFVFATVGKVAMDAISFRGQERGRRPNTGRVQILWRRHPLANPAENLLLIRKTSDPEKNNRDETKLLVRGRTNLDCGSVATPQLKSSNSCTRSPARKTRKRSRGRNNGTSGSLRFPCGSWKPKFSGKERSFFFQEEEISPREAEVQPGRPSDP